MADIGTAYLRVSGDFSQVNSQAVALFNSSKWKNLGKIAGAGVAAGLVAGGALKALYEVGEAFDEVSDKITTRTGATGKELKKLEGSFKSVVSSVPADFDAASEAVAGLAQRLDLTGKPLTQLSKQITQLSMVTGTDVKSNVAAITRLFGDWSVETDKQRSTLDKLYRLTQSTGIEFGNLAELMVQFGSPLRQLGFHFDEAAVMFARFEKEGVNMQTLLPGLRFALKNLALPTDELAKSFDKFGISTKDPHQGLMDIFDLLSGDKIKAADETLLASSVFGGRAWADMKAAIEEGRFEFEDLISAMQKGDETIAASERRTRDFSEQWTLFKNNLMVAVEPAATAVFKAIGDGMEDVTKIIRDKDLDWGEKWDKLSDLAVEAFGDLVSKAAEAGPKIIGALASGIAQAWGDMNPLAKLFTAAGIVRLVGGRGALLGAGVKLGSVLGTGIATGAAGAAAGTAGGAAAGGLLGTMRAKLLPIAKRVGLVGVGVTLADQVIGEFGRHAEKRSSDLFEALEAHSGPGTLFGWDWAGDLPEMLHDSEEEARALIPRLEEIAKSGRTISSDEVDSLRTALSKIPGISSDARREFEEFVAAASKGADKLERVLESKLNLREISLGWSDRMRQMAGISDKELSRIEELLETHPKRGMEALDAAMERGVDSIRRAMKDGRISTEKGARMIHTLLNRQLQDYGMSHGDAEKILKAQKEGSATGLQQGGLVPGLRTGAVVPGYGSGDKVPLHIGGRLAAMVEPNEYVSVANRTATAALMKVNQQVPRLASGGLAFALGPYNIPPIEYDAAHAGGNAHVHISGTTPAWVVAIGKQLQQMGFLVGENPAFGGVQGNHAHYGPTDHWHGGAIDVNSAANLVETQAEVAKIAAVLGGKGVPGGVGGALGKLKLNLPRFLAKYPMFAPAAAGLNNLAGGLETVIGRRAGKFSSAAEAAMPGGGFPANVSGSVASYAQSAVGKRWGAGQWPPFLDLKVRESGPTWDPTITNPSSGAGGIPQALPPSKMGPPAWPPTQGKTSALAQVDWMIDYIAGRYGTPSGALSWHDAHNWYKHGGIVQKLKKGGGVKASSYTANPFGFQGYQPAPHGPPQYTPPWSVTGVTRPPIELPPWLATALFWNKTTTNNLDEEIGVREILDTFSTSEAGSALGPGERAGQIAMNDQLLAGLANWAGLLKTAVAIPFLNSDTLSDLQSDLTEIQGATGSGGRILSVRQKLDSLTGASSSSADAALEMDLLKQINSQLRRDLAIVKAQSPVFGGFPRAHGGGIVGGTGDVLTTLQGGEGVIDKQTMDHGLDLGRGEYEMTITNWDEGRVLIRRVGDERLAEIAGSARRGPVTGVKARLPG